LAKTMGHSVCKLDIMQNVFSPPAKTLYALHVELFMLQRSPQLMWVGLEKKMEQKVK
jgi:hypothetical protein